MAVPTVVAMTARSLVVEIRHPAQGYLQYL